MNFYQAIETIQQRVAGVKPVDCMFPWMKHYHINNTMLLFTKEDRNDGVSIIHYYSDPDGTPVGFQDIKNAIKEAAEHTFDVTAANGRSMRFMWTYTEDFTERSLWWHNSNNDVWMHADDMLTQLFEDNRDIAMDYIEENY